MVPCGINTAPEWALDDVGEPVNDGPNVYTYPDTTEPVRLYLIDTSVANTNGWIDANPRLTLERVELVRAITDPNPPAVYSTDHGTKILSLIGALDTGVAPGTPIHVVNYDIYPAAETTVALLANAIGKAVLDHQTSSNPMRAVICIATSSTDPNNDSGLLTLKINSALNAGIPVIVSSGNHSPLGLDASTIIPANQGTKTGVICVGASDQSDVILPTSNFGAPVDLLAPGNSVRVRTNNAGTPFAWMTGTSPAAALVAGSALTELSINPSLTPAEVENRIKSCAILPPGGQAPKILRTTVAATAYISTPDGPIIEPSNPLPLGGDPTPFNSGPGGPVVDSDSDGMPDIVEVFYGSIGQSGAPPPSVIAPAPSNQTTFKFPVASGLLGGNDPFTLNNGVHWRIRCSTDLTNWLTPNGSLVKTTDAEGQVWLTATIPSPGPGCYVRIELADPGSP